MTVAGAQGIGHVEQHQRGQSETDDRCRQRQVTAKIGGVDDQHDGVRRLDPRHLAAQNIDRDALVLRFCVQAVDARQVDQGDALAVL